MQDEHQPDGEQAASEQNALIQSLRRMSADAMKGREPELLPALQGRRQISIRALVERIMAQFMGEHGENESLAVQEAQRETDRLRLIRDAAEYVFAVESVTVSNAEKADIIRKVYAEVFGFGGLDPLFEDPTITSISLEGPDKAAVRRGHGEYETLPPLFEDQSHMTRMMHRLLRAANAPLHEDHPLVEAGFTVKGRRVALHVAAPPVTILTSVDIRLHPTAAVVLEDLTAAGVMPAQAQALLEAIVRSDAGIVVIGETESGKTTMLSALAQAAGVPAARIAAVERVNEMTLPDEVRRCTVVWPDSAQDGVTFAEQVAIALNAAPDLMLLDEVRTDEAIAVGPLLSLDSVPRQFWAFRGPANVKRLASALSMLARRSRLGGDNESLVHALYQRLPFVVSMRRVKGMLRVNSIGEWQAQTAGGYPDYIELMEMGWEGLRLTGRAAAHTLAVPEDFWKSSGQP